MAVVNVVNVVNVDSSHLSAQEHVTDVPPPVSLRASHSRLLKLQSLAFKPIVSRVIFKSVYTTYISKYFDDSLV